MAAALLPAQRFSFDNYGQHEGLKNLATHCMVQDRQGLLWVGTDGGLFRFDGYRFEQIDIPLEPNSPYITGLAVDGGGRVWVSTNDKLFYMDDSGVHAVFSRDGNFAFELTNNLAADPDTPDGIYLVNSHKIYMASAISGQAKLRYSLETSKANPLLGQVASLTALAGDRLWFGCGTEICSAAGQEIRSYGRIDGLPSGPWTRLFVDREMNLWARSEGHVARFNPDRHRFEAMDRDLASSSLGVRIPSFFEDPQGRILINLSNGLARYERGHWTVFRQKADLPANQIACFYLDRQNSVWVGLDARGIARWLGYDQWESLTTANGLTSDTVWNFARDSRGDFWLATEAGVERIDHATGRIAPQTGSNGVSMSRIQTIAFTGDGHLWNGSDNGKVIDYDPATHNAETVAQLSGVFHLLPDGKGRIWISSMAGLFSVGQERGQRRAEHPQPPAPQGKCYEGARDAQGNLWFICDSGLYRLSGAAWTHIRLPSTYQPSFSAQIALAQDGTIWLSGVNDPVVHFRIRGDEGEELAHWSAAQLGSGLVYIIAFDRHGWLWVGTDEGLNVYNGSQWRSLTTDDGLVWNDIDSDAFFADTDGSVWIGTSGGASHILHPERLFDTSPLPLLLRDVRIGDTLLVDNAPNTVPWSHHPLTAHLSTLDFARAGLVTFRYHIEGLGEDWQDSTKHDLRYPPLEPGKYTLEVVAVDAGTGRKSSPARVSFVVSPPWWRTNAIYALEAAAVLLLLFLLWRWTMRSHLARQRRLEELVRSRTQELEIEKAELLRTRAALEVQAHHDALTGMLNHGAILEALETAMKRAARERSPLGIVLADLDHFKRVNDTYGHLAGDFILQEYARRIAGLIRDYDAAGRYGGEEMLLVLPGLSLENAPERLSTIHASLCEPPFVFKDEQIRVTCSFGFAQFMPGMDSIDSLVDRADRALYVAKDNGRNRIEFDGYKSYKGLISGS